MTSAILEYGTHSDFCSSSVSTLIWRLIYGDGQRLVSDGQRPVSDGSVQKCVDTDTLVTLPHPNQDFDDVHIDIVDPLPPSRSQRCILTCVDRYTRWLEAQSLPDIFADSGSRFCVGMDFTVWLPLNRHNWQSSRVWKPLPSSPSLRLSSALAMSTRPRTIPRQMAWLRYYAANSRLPLLHG